MKNQGSKLLYKYRSLNDFLFIADILINQRLFAAKYTTLNDPMEGIFKFNPNFTSLKLIDEIQKAKEENLKICSLSSEPNDELMWAHYADGARGLAIGVYINCSNKYKVVPVEYDGIPNLKKKINKDYEEVAINILSHKLKDWSYEEEERVFISTSDSSPYINNVCIKEVILGQRMFKRNKVLITKFIKKINPDVKIINQIIKIK